MGLTRVLILLLLLGIAQGLFLAALLSARRENAAANRILAGAMVAFSLVLLLGVSIVVLVDRLLSPMHPEKILLRGVRRFLAGCARVTGDIGLSMARQPQRARKLRRRVFESRIVPFAARLNKLEQQLDYDLFPDNTPASALATPEDVFVEEITEALFRYLGQADH